MKMIKHYARTALFVLALAGFLAGPLGLQAYPYACEYAWKWSRDVFERENNLLLPDGWKLRSTRKYDFSPGSGTITYFQGISSTLTNRLIVETYSQHESENCGDLCLDSRVEVFYNRYAENGMVTNILEMEPGEHCVGPGENWFIGTIVREQDMYKIVDKCSFWEQWENPDDNTWGIANQFFGSKIDFKITFRIGPKGSYLFSPTLTDVRRESGKRQAWATAGSPEFFIPNDVPPMFAPWNKGKPFLWNPSIRR